MNSVMNFIGQPIDCGGEMLILDLPYNLESSFCQFQLVPAKVIGAVLETLGKQSHGHLMP